jgi:4-amino-4-deoxy-L-arabinose transferase-like glycosyltransferase
MRTAPLALAILSAALIFPNLGEPMLWADEGDTAVYARTILQEGLPRAWDGRTFSESDAGHRLNSQLVMVGTPWLPFYVAAASFAAFGESAFSARLPFALAGVASVLLLYALVVRTTGDRRAALLAAILLLASVQFLLYSRQCRHYSLNIALSLAALLGFLRLREHPRDPWFAVAVVLLFHCQPLPAGVILFALAGLTQFHTAFRDVRWRLLGWAAVVVALTAPWVAIASTGWAANSAWPQSIRDLGMRVGQLSVEILAAIPLLGWALLLPIVRKRLTREDQAWLALALAVVGAYLALTPLVLAKGHLWAYGLRYLCALLPLGAGVTGLLIARASRGSVALLALFACTHIPGSAWLWASTGPPRKPAETPVAVHMASPGVHRWLRTEWIGYARELFEPNPGPVSAIVRFLREHAAPGEILITNYEWEPIYFHTDLPQGLKIMPGYPVHAVARASGLPEYVFSTKGARWVVWRPLWDGYRGYHLERIEQELRARGASLELVASFPDARWENRPELHFHRFPGDFYPFPFGIRFSGADPRVGKIFRVDEAARPSER